MKGSGITYYWHRTPGDPENTEQDRKERAQTIVAVHAGHAAQLKIFPDSPEINWADDRREISLLLDEMKSPQCANSNCVAGNVVGPSQQTRDGAVVNYRLSG